MATCRLGRKFLSARIRNRAAIDFGESLPRKRGTSSILEYGDRFAGPGSRKTSENLTTLHFFMAFR